MKIDSVEIKNFRGYENLTEIKFDDLTVFVGKNDIGKSTVLEALDLFFYEGKGVIKIDKSDVNKNCSAKNDLETIISVTFTDLPEEIVLDSTAPTSLKDEYLLNFEGKLEIIKKYNDGGTAKIWILANHPSNQNCSDLLLRKNNELKKKIEDNDIECDNKSINSVMRKSIWEYYSSSLDLELQEIDASKEDAKKIWEKIKTHLPVYSLFQSDRANTDGDSEIQDPLKEAVKLILNDQEIQNKLNLVAVEVESKLKEVADRTLNKLKEIDLEIAKSLNPVIPETDKLKWSDVFKNVSIAGDQDIPINKRGSGIKRLILLSFFRAEVERRMIESDETGVIYAIEEPETSQHSNNQKILIESLIELSKHPNVQVILTTHSSFLVKQLEFENLRLITDEVGSKEIKYIEKSQLRYPSLNEVNYLAFNEVCEEYHDELYSFIEFQKWFEDYEEGKPKMKYIRIHKSGTKDEQKILTEYIRHQIHHPENKHNARYTIEQLKESIVLMRDFIDIKNKEEEIEEP